MQLTTVRALWITGINYTLDFETKMDPLADKVISHASTPEFKALATSLSQACKKQGANLAEVLRTLQEKESSTDNAIAKGMINATETMIELCQAGPVQDAAVIVELQQQTLYRAATYGAMLNYAHLTGNDLVAPLIEANLNACKEANMELTALAQSVINPAAMKC